MISNSKTSSTYPSLITVSKRLFKSICERLNVQTAYVTKRGKTAMTVLSSYNEKEHIIPEGYSVEYGGTYCRLIIMNEESRMFTENLMTFNQTRDLEVTPQLNVKGFLGVTLSSLQGEVFGTLCVMDKQEREFSKDDILYLKSMAEILSHLIELDKTKNNISYLNVSIIPITKGVCILPIQGVIDDQRADQIISTVLNFTAVHHIDYFIIDLSGLVILDDLFPPLFVNLVKSLELMGVKTIITGITPYLAKQESKNGELSGYVTKNVRNLESALAYIGFHFNKH